MEPGRRLARAQRDANVAVALDLPLHGPRTSAKLSERLVSAFAALARGRASSTATAPSSSKSSCARRRHDLARTLDALLAPGELDPDRVALIGLGLGARVADAFLADDDRVRAPSWFEHAGRRCSPSSRRRLASRSTRQDAPRDWAFEAERFLESALGAMAREALAPTRRTTRPASENDARSETARVLRDRLAAHDEQRARP